MSTDTQATYLMNGLACDITGYKAPITKGVYLQNHYLYNVIPLAQNTSAIAASQRVVATGSTDPDQAFSITLSFNDSVILRGSERYTLADCPRIPLLNFGAGVTVGVTTVTITGLDNNLKLLVAQQQIPIGATGIVVSNKAFYLISKIFFSSDPGVAVSVGWSDYIGIPHFVPSSNYVHSIKWNGAAIADNLFTPGFKWRTTSTDSLNANYLAPTGFTADAHGYVNLSTQGSRPNGSRMLSIFYYVYGADAELYAQAQNSIVIDSTYQTIVYASPIGQLPIRTNTSGVTFVDPYLIEQDLTGAQYPGDQLAMTRYRLALAS